MEARELPVVTARTLSREPRRKLARLQAGERMILCRHGRPVGTLQPLDGLVEHPLGGRAQDVTGSPLLYPHQEIEKLTPIMRELLRDCLTRVDAITISKLGDRTGCMEALEELELRGLVRKTSRGRLLTGRGFVIREALFERAGRPDPRYD